MLIGRLGFELLLMMMRVVVVKEAGAGVEETGDVEGRGVLGTESDGGRGQVVGLVVVEVGGEQAEMLLMGRDGGDRGGSGGGGARGAHGTRGSADEDRAIRTLAFRIEHFFFVGAYDDYAFVGLM